MNTPFEPPEMVPYGWLFTVPPEVRLTPFLVPLIVPQSLIKFQEWVLPETASIPPPLLFMVTNAFTVTELVGGPKREFKLAPACKSELITPLWLNPCRGLAASNANNNNPTAL